MNELCGAEYVHKDQKVPRNYCEKEHKGRKCASFDGDADRLIYWYEGEDGVLKIIDGDKQFALIVMYVKELLARLEVKGISHVLVNTGYCNSKVTKFLMAKGVHNEICPTGVKNAHPIVQKYDIGANDEPNGHGTVTVKWDKINDALKDKE